MNTEIVIYRGTKIELTQDEWGGWGYLAGKITSGVNNIPSREEALRAGKRAVDDEIAFRAAIAELHRKK